MKHYVKVFLFVLPLFFSLKANAFFLDTSALVFTDTYAPASGSSVVTGRNNYDVSIGFSISKSLGLGWNYTTVTTTDTASSATTTYGSTDMGPKLYYEITKDRSIRLGLAYNLIATGTYQAAGGTQETWRGTSIKADIGYSPPISESFSIGIKLNYYSSAYTEVIVANTTYTKVNNARTQLYPSLAFTWTY